MATTWESGDDGSSRRRRSQTRRRNASTFAYDVGVNLLANLLAAAVIYLIAQATGLLKSDTVLTVLTLLFVFSSAVTGFIMTIRTVRQRRHERSIIFGGLISFSQVALLFAYNVKEPLQDIDRRLSLGFYITLALPIGILVGFAHAQSFGKRATENPSALRVIKLSAAWSIAAVIVVLTNTFGFHVVPFYRT